MSDEQKTPPPADGVVAPMDPEAVKALAAAFLKVVEENDPRIDVLLTALAETVVAFSLELVHLQGELTHEEATKQLARFYSYTIDLAAVKVIMLNEQLASQKRLEAYAEEFKRVVNPED